MKKSLKGISVFSVFMLFSLTSCGQTGISEPKSISSVVSDSKTSSTQEEKDEIEVESITLSAQKTELNINEEVQIEAEVLPTNASDKSLTYESSDTKVAEVDDNGLVTAKGIGSAVISAFSKDKKVKGEITITVTSLQSKVISFLKDSQVKEETQALKGSLTESTGTSYEYHAYKDGAQTKRTTSEGSVTVLNLSRSTEVHSLTLTSSDITAEDFEVNKDIDEQTAKDSTSMLEYHMEVDGTQTSSKIYGLSSIALNYLTGDYFGTKEGQIYMSVGIQETKYEVTTNTTGINDTIVYSYMGLGIDSSKRLTTLDISLDTYAREDFDARKHKPKENASPKKETTIKGSLEYGDRPESDDFKLNESDYKVKSFKVDDSKFVKDNGKNVMYLNQSFPISVTEEEPKIHLKESYSIESFSPTGIVTENDNYFTARSIGTTVMTVTSSLGRTASIEIEVRERPVESISFVGKVSTLKVGESVSLSAYCSPYEVKDSPYSMKFKTEDQSAFASLTKDAKDSKKYILKGLKKGTVTVVAYPDDSPSITAEMTIEIQEETKPEPPASDLLKTLLSSPYTDTYVSVVFNEDGTGTLTNKYGGKAQYSFSWSLNKDTITFSKISLLSGTEQTSSTVRIGNEYTKTGKLSADGKTLTISQAMGSGNTFASDYSIKQK